MAFHFREACANWLTNPAYDPDTLTAEYKACAVRVEVGLGERLPTPA
jgi:formate dehydrogenase major subunit